LPCPESTGENCHISQSVIGRNCRIGNNVTMIGTFIHDNVTIQVRVWGQAQPD